MDIADLRVFLAVARNDNLRAGADALAQSPSAVSKAIRRLETSLQTRVFDRVGKRIRLNADGDRLRAHAQPLVALAEQTHDAFRGGPQQIHCRVAGPALLQWRYLPEIAGRLHKRHADALIGCNTLFEDAALVALTRGEVDFALITSAAVHASLAKGVEAVELGQIRMQLAAGHLHPLVLAAAASRRGKSVTSVRTAEVLQHDFVCPTRSMLCGIDRGSRSDGWRDDQLPRRVRFRLDDLQLLLALVRSGQALAYLPDFALADANLMRLRVTDCAYECVETAYMAWRPALASGWQNQLAATSRAPKATS